MLVGGPTIRPNMSTLFRKIVPALTPFTPTPVVVLVEGIVDTVAPVPVLADITDDCPTDELDGPIV